MTPLSAFKHKIPIQVRFNDIDRVNHVNNAVYLTYIELGRVHYLNEVLKREIDWDKKGFILAHTAIDYKTPIYLRDEVFCYTKTVILGNKSVTLESVIVKKKGDEYIECARSKGVLVAMDYATNKSIPLPKEWRQQAQTYEEI